MEPLSSLDWRILRFVFRAGPQGVGERTITSSLASPNVALVTIQSRLWQLTRRRLIHRKKGYANVFEIREIGLKTLGRIVTESRLGERFWAQSGGGGGVSQRLAKPDGRSSPRAFS